MSARTFKLIGAAGAAALTVGALASPALAAPKTFNYDCPAFAGFAANTAVSVDLDPGTIPATMVAGQKVKNAATMTARLDASQTAVAHGVGTSVSGSMVATGVSNTFPFNLTFPATPIPATPGATMQVVGTGTATIRPLKAGTWTVKAGDMTATLALTGGTGGPLTVPFECTAPTGAAVNYGTIQVSKDKTTTAVVAGYSAAKNLATGKAKVKSHFGLKATGKVKFVLKRGTHTVDSKTTKLNKKAIAKAAFKGVKKPGKYKIIGKYLGNPSLRGSKGVDRFVVR